MLGYRRARRLGALQACLLDCEASILQSISHPYIVKLIEVFEKARQRVGARHGGMRNEPFLVVSRLEASSFHGFSMPLPMEQSFRSDGSSW